MDNICDGDLVRRVRSGDTAALRWLVERHFVGARARAARLCAHPDDVDDVVQEAFLQAFAGLGRLRDPDRFGAWLAGIIRNISLAAARQAPLMLLADWPEDLQPASAQGPPSAEDLDRAEVVRAAVAGLPGGQRRAVELYYFADLPVGQVAGSPGTAKATLHQARRRLREHITARRPDLIPSVPRRILMTTVRIAHAEPYLDTRLDGTTAAKRVLVVLADDRGHRAVGLWLPARHGMALSRILDGRACGDPVCGGPAAVRRRILAPVVARRRLRRHCGDFGRRDIRPGGVRPRRVESVHHHQDRRPRSYSDSVSGLIRILTL